MGNILSFVLVTLRGTVKQACSACKRSYPWITVIVAWHQCGLEDKNLVIGMTTQVRYTPYCEDLLGKNLTSNLQGLPFSFVFLLPASCNSRIICSSFSQSGTCTSHVTFKVMPKWSDDYRQLDTYQALKMRMTLAIRCRQTGHWGSRPCKSFMPQSWHVSEWPQFMSTLSIGFSKHIRQSVSGSSTGGGAFEVLFSAMGWSGLCSCTARGAPRLLPISLSFVTRPAMSKKGKNCCVPSTYIIVLNGPLFCE